MREQVRECGAAALGLTLWLAGCGSDSSVDPDDVRTWANTASAVAVYSHAYGPVAFADGETTFADPECPQTTDDATTVTITGGCTDESDERWIGSATVVRTDSGESELTLDGYGHFGDPAMRAGVTGTVALRRLGDALHEFDVDLVHEGGMTTSFDYSGKVNGGYDGASVWSGSGVIERDGLVAPTGIVYATTEDEKIDNDLCSGQPVSGRTTIEHDGHTFVITYDGAADCDDAQAARFSEDGEDRGLLTGIVCSMGRVPTNPRGAAFVALFGALWLRRACARRSSEPRPATGWRSPT